MVRTTVRRGAEEKSGDVGEINLLRRDSVMHKTIESLTAREMVIRSENMNFNRLLIH